MDDGSPKRRPKYTAQPSGLVGRAAEKRSRKRKRRGSERRCLDFGEEMAAEGANTSLPPNSPVISPKVALAEVQERFEAAEREYKRLRAELFQQPEIRGCQAITDDCKRRACVRMFQGWARSCYRQMFLPSRGTRRVAALMSTELKIDPIRLENPDALVNEQGPQRMQEVFEGCLAQLWNVQAFVDTDPSHGGRHARHELVLFSDRSGQHITISEHRYGSLAIRHPKRREERASARVRILGQILLESGVSLVWIAREIQAIAAPWPPGMSSAPGKHSTNPMMVDDHECDGAATDSESNQQVMDLCRKMHQQNQALAQRVDAMADLVSRICGGTTSSNQPLRVGFVLASNTEKEG